VPVGGERGRGGRPDVARVDVADPGRARRRDQPAALRHRGGGGEQVGPVRARAQQHRGQARGEQVALDLAVPGLEEQRRRHPGARELHDAGDPGRSGRVDRRALVLDLARDLAAGQEQPLDAVQPVRAQAVLAREPEGDARAAPHVEHGVAASRPDPVQRLDVGRELLRLLLGQAVGRVPPARCPPRSSGVVIVMSPPWS
jgi:hypothetical protein